MNQAMCSVGHLVPRSDGKMNAEVRFGLLQESRHDNRVAGHSLSIYLAGAEPFHGGSHHSSTAL